MPPFRGRVLSPVQPALSAPLAPGEVGPECYSSMRTNRDQSPSLRTPGAGIRTLSGGLEEVPGAHPGAGGTASVRQAHKTPAQHASAARLCGRQEAPRRQEDALVRGVSVVERGRATPLQDRGQHEEKLSWGTA